MRIVYLHQYFNLPTDSGGTRSYEMGRRLVAAGHEVAMITSDQSGRFEEGWHITKEAGIKVHWLPVPYSNRMSYPQRIKAFIIFAWCAALRAANIPADVVIATSTPLTIALPGVFAARRQRIPMVFEVRDLWPEIPIAVGALNGPMVPAAKWLERFAYRKSERIIALSPGIKDGIIHTGYPQEKVTVIPNSADLDLFGSSRLAGEQFRSKLEWLQKRPLVLYAGTLGKINGVSYFTKLAADVQKIAPEIRFLVVGDGVEKEKVVKTAKRLAVWNQNFFMEPPVAKQEIPAVLSAASVATSLVINLPEMWHNSANKFFDTLASGTPIAINYQGWQAELIKETGAGIVLSPTVIKQAARDLVDLLQDSKRLHSAGQAARHLAETQFSRDDLATDLEGVLMRAVQENNVKLQA